MKWEVRRQEGDRATTGGFSLHPLAASRQHSPAIPPLHPSISASRRRPLRSTASSSSPTASQQTATQRARTDLRLPSATLQEPAASCPIASWGGLWLPFHIAKPQGAAFQIAKKPIPIQQRRARDFVTAHICHTATCLRQEQPFPKPTQPQCSQPSITGAHPPQHPAQSSAPSPSLCLDACRPHLGAPTPYPLYHCSLPHSPSLLCISQLQEAPPEPYFPKLLCTPLFLLPPLTVPQGPVSTTVPLTTCL